MPPVPTLEETIQNRVPASNLLLSLFLVAAISFMFSFVQNTNTPYIFQDNMCTINICSFDCQLKNNLPGVVVYICNSTGLGSRGRKIANSRLACFQNK